jgi:Protein of unknown function (DUF2510)
MPEEPGWYPDPKEEANYRFYDGRKWTKSLAAEPPVAERPDDGPVEGGLLGLLEHQPVNTPLDPELHTPPPRTDPDAHVPLAPPAWSSVPVAETPPPPPPPPPPPAPPPPPSREAPASEAQPPPRQT